MINKCFMGPFEIEEKIKEMEEKAKETNKKTKEEVREESRAKLVKFLKWIIDSSIIR